jgi:hypothetical protein
MAGSARKWPDPEGAVPSPIGHALGAAAAGWLVAGGRPSWRSTAALVAVGSHSTYTHSIGAVALVTAVAWAVTRDHRWALALGAAWASHLLLDWMGSDTSHPIGIMALWPFSTAHYQSTLYLFDAISRRYWLPEQFIWGNLRAAAREVAILLPIAVAAAWVSSNNRSRSS